MFGIINKREKLIKKILGIEKEWFRSLNAENPDCQKNLENFMKMRKVNFTTWSVRTLSYYLDHLKNAQKKGRNLMAEKYLIMEGQIKIGHIPPEVEEIVKIEKEWFDEVYNKYPALFKDDKGKFENYLKSELITYSDNCRKSYLNDLKIAMNKGKNLVEERYREMAKILGFSSIEEMLSHNS